MREALLGVAVGKKGIGKTYTTLSVINQYIKGGLNIKPRRALILDVNDEFESVKAIKLSDVELFTYHPKIECRRVRPYNDDGTKMTLSDVANALWHILHVYKGGSWKDRSYWLNPGTKRYMNSDIGTDYIGFRCAMTRLGSKSKVKKTARHKRKG